MNDDEIFFIADLGENPTILINGKEEPIPRYVVWNKPAVSSQKIRFVDGACPEVQAVSLVFHLFCLFPRLSVLGWYGRESPCPVSPGNCRLREMLSWLSCNSAWDKVNLQTGARCVPGAEHPCLTRLATVILLPTFNQRRFF